MVPLIIQQEEVLVQLTLEVVVVVVVTMEDLHLAVEQVDQE